ncbi:unnamed protein product [Arctia plantaginis]|uniref:Uncharacterized protein n=1 Tax=Arctia plantaginis TaxID=874455 RepID=A0A8S1AK41_ARCPL|nr:unnamed protein product [Arctia plantaginis]
MWTGLWFAFSVSTVCSQYTNTKISQDGASFSWGWHMSPTKVPERVLGHYYVKQPQSVQQVNYSAGNTYQGTNNDMLQASSSAHGHKLQETKHQLNGNVNGRPQLNRTHIQPPPPIDPYLLQQQYKPYTQSVQPEQVLQIPGTVQTTPVYSTGVYNTPSLEHSKHPQNEALNEYRSPIQIYKNHNCSINKESISKDLQNDLNKSKALFAESYSFQDVNNFATSYPQSHSYKGAIQFRVEAPGPNARNERFYYTTVGTPTYENTTLEGIDKLVASTQDLISNEDLLFINDAAEKYILEESEATGARRLNNSNNLHGHDTRNHITVKAKIGNIVGSNIEHLQNNQNGHKILQSDSNKYNFATPIVVSENSYTNFKEQIVDNIVSTMVPYMVNGYQIVGVKDTSEEVYQNIHDSKIINVTPRPINQNYLAPITVALRLINANNTEIFNRVEDPEASDSELISDTVNSPSKGKTVVEVQKSIPVEITHINDVEVHEYLDFDEGRSNNKGPFDAVKSLYNKYMDALNTKKIMDNMDKFLYQYETAKHENSKNEEDNDSDNTEASENMHTEVRVSPNEDSKTQRSEHVQYYESYENDNKQIIQPIVIEKEVPVTKFVDRVIEKKVPYPQHIQVQVPVDRPYPVEVPVEKIVEKPVEITKYVNKPYPVEIPRPYPVEVKVPYPVQQNVYVDRPVHIPYPVEKLVEKEVIHPVPVPTPVGIPIQIPYPVEHKILYPVPVDRPVPIQVEKPVEKIIHKEVPVPYAVEKRVPYPVHYETRVPVPYPVEKRIPIPVERIVEKPVTVTKYVDRPIHIQVPVPQPIAVPVHVPQPYPVDRIVEKKIPYPVQVEKIVEKPVKVPYPVEKIVEKIVEKPFIVTKYVDKPYPVEKFIDRPIHIPVPYVYSHSETHSESRNNHQYEPYKVDKSKNAPNQKQLYLTEYFQQLKAKEQKEPIQSTRWGNQYASSYQYINNTSEVQPDEEKRLNSLGNYLNHLTNVKSASQYYGPVPIPNQDDWWQNNKNYVVEVKMRRTDREPKMSNLRIEYGGFKPPLIPSTEVDLDGMPIDKKT